MRPEAGPARSRSRVGPGRRPNASERSSTPDADHRNFIGIALFAGLTAWDTQRLKLIGAQVENHPARGGLVVVGALSLYLDFINLFVLILRASSRR